ncbi:hypothetical protein RND71_018117 [Anisodus tanguticus]|uniref:Probable 6-phosphogluconolactonase n=1 Tax=Anisodus tanguticus TaxID=243964 RepID=A0AAE1VGM2_9SOLA|nr:hypothetical protein RND71_018117 [Anisodus tanguticus]
MADTEVQVFDSEEELAVSLAKCTTDLSDKFCKERDAFTVVVSGGSLIKSQFHEISLRKKLAEKHLWRFSLINPWTYPHAEVKPESAACSRIEQRQSKGSRSYLIDCGVTGCLLVFNIVEDGNTEIKTIPIPAGHVYAINDTLSAEGAADDYETCLKHLIKSNIVDISKESGFPKFDIMLLGMGPDGHVASLFPGHPLVHEKEKWVTFINDSPKPPSDRITFTFPVINSSANIALVAAGAGKADVVHKSLGDSKSSDLLPVQMVSPEGELIWFLDKAAASKLWG